MEENTKQDLGDIYHFAQEQGNEFSLQNIPTQLPTSSEEKALVFVKNVIAKPKLLFDAIDTVIEKLEDGEVDEIDTFSLFEQLEKRSKDWKVHCRSFAVDEAKKYDKDGLRAIGWQLMSPIKKIPIETSEMLTIIELEKKLKARKKAEIDRQIAQKEIILTGGTEFLKRV